MKPEDEARAFFADRTALEKVDEIHRYIRIAVRDAFPGVLEKIANSIKAIGDQHPDWAFKNLRHNHRTPVLCLQLQKTRGIFKSGIRIEFAYDERYIDKKFGFPRAPWVGVHADGSADKKFDAIADRLKAHFSYPEADYKDGYPIFGYLADWPNSNGGYVALAPLLVAVETETMANDIAAFISRILDEIEGRNKDQHPTAETRAPGP